MNVAILDSSPFAQVFWLFHATDWFDYYLSVTYMDVYGWTYSIRRYSVPILGAALFPVSALIATRGWGFMTCIRRLGTLARRRPGYLLTTYAGLLLIAVVPIGEWLSAPLDSANWAQSLFPGSILAALCSGLEAALFIYSTALAANALADLDESTGARPPAGADP